MRLRKCVITEFVFIISCFDCSGKARPPANPPPLQFGKAAYGTTAHIHAFT